ncbi:hypothetical protein BDB00DRAFT_808170 [Zychaea mexicana]|uniref:uncharacterized protein n=1 Tax=Zychaea mexicana TaxID=64656 RepID=UPI0022FED022|nr:uncharacterized protein BDB00DRAFT_808170 [Zychaea mexicana]KAI9496641.1 hypothetical protein BDB00DRAFT_808170 [Zychaea mexicana]
MPIQAPVAEQTAATTANRYSETHSINNGSSTLKKIKVESTNDTNEGQNAEGPNALTKNEDYQSTLNALNLLHHQLKKATKDIETLNKLKREALDNPYDFLVDLKEKKSSKRRVPKLQKIASVPTIDWSKYRFLPDSRIAEQTAYLAALAQNINKPSPAYRNILDHAGPFYRQEPNSPSGTVSYLQRETARVARTVRELPSRAGSVSDGSDRESDDEGPKNNSGAVGQGKGKRRTSVAQGGTITPSEPAESVAIMWRPSQSATPRLPLPTNDSDGIDEMLLEHDMELETRAPTYNQPWSDEEQRRLEELLEIYPDEQVQAQRFNKISKALGTRSARQVASRVQKYFIKLAKLGLPVPGRVSIPPSSTTKHSRGGGNRRGKISKVKSRGGSSSASSNSTANTAAASAASVARTAKPAMRTSGAGYNTMVSGGITNTRISGAHYLTTHGPPSALMSDDEDSDVKQAMLNATNPKAAIQQVEGTGGDPLSSASIIHEGYACDGCGTEPIVGVRYKCTVCDVSEEIDLCSKCMAAGTFQNDHHTPDHPFEAIHVANPLPYYADNDYAPNEYLGEYSYLGL